MGAVGAPPPKKNSGRRYEYRQKFLGDDECPVQKKKFSPRANLYDLTPEFSPTTFLVSIPRRKMRWQVSPYSRTTFQQKKDQYLSAT